MTFFDDKRTDIEGLPRIDLDDSERETLRRLQRYDVPLKLHWDLGYQPGQEELLKSLYEKGKEGQWNAETDVDWDTPVGGGEEFANADATMLGTILGRATGAPEDTVREAVLDEIAFTLSQLLHGEQAALQLTAQLVNAMPDLDTKFYAASQVVDEARHVEVLAKFLNEKYGKVWEVDGTLKFLLDQLLAADTWFKKAVGMQILFEGMALGIMAGLEQSVRNPLLRDILRRVVVDEARHAAFGVSSLKRHVPELMQSERDELEDFAFDVLECLYHGSGVDMTRSLCPRYGLEPDRLLRGVLRSDSWKLSQVYVYNHTCLPNLEKVGLLTARTRPRYQKVGILPQA